MHPAAFLYVDEKAADLLDARIVVECGSRWVNGAVRELFPHALYCGIDREDGPGVDIVADFRHVAILEPADVVICCEVLEHDPDPASLVAKARELLKPGGTYIMTCAGVGRLEHSGVDGNELHEGEHYRNVSAEELAGWLDVQGWSWWEIDVADTDTRCVARR